MTDKQLENLYKIKDLCCEEIKHCCMSCYHCSNECNEQKILILLNEVLNEKTTNRN